MVSGIYAQHNEVFEEWTSSEGVQEYFYKNVTKTDVSRNVYVAGATLNGDGDYDLLITKFDRNGDFVWKDTIAGPGGGHDFATDIDFDHSGNVVVSGSIAASGGENNNMLAVKYNAAGTELWRYSHDHNGNAEGAAALAIDAANNVYLTGATQQSGGYTDMITIKIDSNAVLQWEELFDGNNLHDAGVKIELSGSSAIVTGGGQLNSLTWKVMVLSYAQADGNLMGSTTSSGTDPGVEEVTDLVIDENDNIYIAGSTINGLSGYDMMLIKLDEDLNIEWTKEWDGDGMTDKGSGVRVAPNGDVYLSGTTETAAGDDIALIKLNANGDYIWEETYNSADGVDDVAAALEWHDEGYLYIAGHTYKVSSLDYLTLKYDSTGTLLWDITYNSPFNKDDRATNLAIDDEGDIIVSGQCEKNDSVMTYYTVKYVERRVPEIVLKPIGKNFGFIRNDGQLFKSDETPASEIDYYSNSGPYHLFANSDGFSMGQYKLSEDTLTNDTILRVDLRFLNPNQDRKLYGEKPQENFYNFYTYQTTPKERVPTFSGLYYSEVWRLVDVQVSSSDYTLQVTAKPSAKLSDIQFEFTGTSGLQLDADSSLVVNTLLKPFRFPAPRVYQMNGQGEFVELNWQPHYIINQSEVGFAGFGSYDTGKDLVIVMAPPCTEDDIDFAGGLCYGSYFGSTADDFVRTSDLDEDGSYLVGGFTADYLAFPVLNLQTDAESTNGSQIFVTKFNEEMEVHYSTIIFGASEDYLHGAVFHENGVYGCGVTWSWNFPIIGTQAPATSNAANGDAVVFRLEKSDGSRTWSTMLGGTGADVANDIKVDQNSRIYIVGRCQHGGGTFPYEEWGGAHNETAQNHTGFIARFHPSLDLEWCTAYGGSGDDDLQCLDIDSEGSIVVAGHTYSSDLYMEEVSGVYQKESIGGTQTYFLAKFNSNGTYAWSTYFGSGDEAWGHIYTWKNIAISEDDKIYFGGSTKDPTGLDFENPGFGHYSEDYITDPGGISYRNNYSFIAQFSASLNSEWLSLLGTGGEISQVRSVKVHSGTLAIGGITFENDPLVFEIPPYYFNDELPEFGIFQSQTSFLNVFNRYSYELQYGTILDGFEHLNHMGGVTGITISPDNEITISGDSKSYYYCENPIKFGVPVNPIDNEDSYFHANNPSVYIHASPNITGYIARVCIPELYTSLREPELHDLNNLTIYPNPTTGHSYLKLEQLIESGTIVITGADGRLIQSQPISGNRGIYELDLTHLNPGLYLLSVSNAEGIVGTTRLIKL